MINPEETTTAHGAAPAIDSDASKLKQTHASASGQQHVISERNSALLNLIQSDFPLVERPFAALAEQLGQSEDEVRAVLRQLKEARVVRQISAIFDSRNLGYRSSLVAMKVAPEQILRAAEIINRHPGVSHNYQRNHPYNLWFTMAVPPHGDLQRDVDEMHQLAGAEQTLMLPTLRLFKIGVTLDMSGEADILRKAPAKVSEQHARSETEVFDAPPPRDQAIIRVLQRDLPLEPRPFDAWAAELGTAPSELLHDMKRLAAAKLMRRFAAVLRHRDAGFTSNAMVAWQVPQEQIHEVGQRMASFAAVSHCYQRPVYPDWPYSIFTMIHGRKESDCTTVVEAISAETGITNKALLFSTKEFKKTRVQYYTGDYEEYRARIGANS